jgi:SPP1 family predicted phage head-tail adaptor
VKVGAMRHRIGIYARAMTKDTYGQEVETFTLSTTRWGSVEVTNGAKEEGYEGQQEKDAIEITMRFFKTISVLGRVAFNGSSYQITSVIDVNGLGVEYRVTAERIR